MNNIYKINQFVIIPNEQLIMRRLIVFLAFIMLVVSSNAIVYLMMDGGAVDQSEHLNENDISLLRYLLMSWKVAVLSVFVLLLLTKQWRIFQLNPTWGSLFMLCWLSILWAEYPQVARSSALIILFSFFLVQIHFEMCGWQSVIRLIHNVFILLSVLSIAFVLLLPSYGISVGEHDGKWQGVFPHKNELGLFASMAFVFFLGWYKFDRSLSTLIGIPLSAILIVGSGSTTAYFCLGASSFLFVLLYFPFSRKLIYSWRYTLFATVALICIYAIYLSISTSLVDIGDKDTSFSNRNLIWAYILLQISESPWLGHGLNQISAAVMSDSSDFKESVGFVVSTAHNGFLEVAHALGFIGLLIVTIIIAKRLSLTKDDPELDFIFMFLLVYIIQNMFSSSLLGFNLYLVMLMYISNLSKFKSRGDLLILPVKNDVS